MDKNRDSFGARPGRTAPASAAARERQAAALRENLQRRKAQARGQAPASHQEPHPEPHREPHQDPSPDEASG